MITPAPTLIALVFCSSMLSAEPVSEVGMDLASVVAEHVQPAIDAELLPGAVVGIHKDGETVFFPIGTLDYDQDEAPTVQTLYEIGSVSKVITGVLFADAVRRDEVTRDTAVNELLPDGFSIEPMEGEQVRLWHLTTHTSGWPTAPINLRPADGERPFLGYTREMMFQAISVMKPQTKPGTAFEYSNLGVGLLGTLIADNAGSTYEQLVADRVLTPLEIEDFSITLDEAQRARLAPATASGRATKHWVTMGPLDPAGMWIATAPALMDFAMANLGVAGRDIDRSLTSSREMLFDTTGFGSVCSGWMLARDGSTYWHNGMTGGYSSYMGINAEHDVAVVILTNGATFQTTVIGEKLMQAALGLDPEPVVIPVVARLDGAYCDRLTGVYRSAMGFDMTITTKRGRVFAQITGQQSLDLVPAEDKENRFRYELVDAELGFELPEEGDASAVTLYQNGMEIRCERTED